MTFDEFVNSRRGKAGWGTNPSDKGECLGLLNDGEVQMRGILYPIQGITYARDFLNGNNTRPDLYERVENDPNSATQVPSKGDMIVWGNLGDPRGHVGYVWDAPQGVNSLQVFDQWQGAPAQIRNYTYSTCKGWWHLKPQTPPEPAIGATQRKVGPAGVKYRKEPNTSSELLITSVITDGIVDGGQIANLVGYVNGQNVDGNDVWFKGTGGGYMWSGAFENPSPDGLADLTPPPPIAPESPPVSPQPPKYEPKDPEIVDVTASDFPSWIKFEVVNDPDDTDKVNEEAYNYYKEKYNQDYKYYPIESQVHWWGAPDAGLTHAGVVKKMVETSDFGVDFVLSAFHITLMGTLKSVSYTTGPRSMWGWTSETDPTLTDDVYKTLGLLHYVVEKKNPRLANEPIRLHKEFMQTACSEIDTNKVRDYANKFVTGELVFGTGLPAEKPVDPPKPDLDEENNSLLKQILAIVTAILDKLTSIFK